MPGKLFCIYSDVSKRFYNADPSQKIPAAVRSIQYIEHLNRIGIYAGTETNDGVSTGRSLYVFMDLALNKSPVYIEENDKWYPYYVCEANSDTLVGYYETLSKTIVS